ncbi:protein of unknown function [Paraburkholderia kururiensis]
MTAKALFKAAATALVAALQHTRLSDVSVQMVFQLSAGLKNTIGNARRNF